MSGGMVSIKRKVSLLVEALGTEVGTDIGSSYGLLGGIGFGKLEGSSIGKTGSISLI